MTGWLLTVRHLPDMNLELELFGTGLAAALLGALLLAMLYLALEPFARRAWPQILISWNRLLAGRFRDPLVGRDLLVGCLLGVFHMLVWPLSWDLHRLLGYPPPRPISAMEGLNGVRAVAASIVGSLGAVGNVVITLFLLVLFRMLFRKRWAATAIVVVIVGAQEILATSRAFTPGILPVMIGAIAVVVVLVRFGVLAAFSGVVVFYLLAGVAWPSSLSVWYAQPALAALAVVTAIAIFGFRCALGGRPAFGQAWDQE
jgi:serine/threonine-protein kinase